jgi:hypothetical protein
MNQERTNFVTFNAMEPWEGAMEALKQNHFGPHAHMLRNSGSSISASDGHDPEREAIVAEHQTGDTAVISTETGLFWGPKYREYQVTRENGIWYLRAIFGYLENETEPAFTTEEREALLKQVAPDAQLPEPERGVTPNCDRLFEDGRKVELYHEEFTLRVHSGGKLSVPSGVLGVRDFGYSPEDMRPLTLRIPSGDYDMEYAEARSTVVAARLLLDSTTPAVSYQPAPAVGEDSHYAGVDKGNVALFDAGTFMHLTKRGHEEHYNKDFAADRWRADKDHTEPTFIHLGNPPSEKVTCIVVSSGHGDGSYPCYWGLGAQGKPVSLVVDFLVLAEFLTDRCKLPWPPVAGAQELTHPMLTDHKVKITWGPENGRLVITVEGYDFARASWRSADGKEMVNSDQCCSGAGGGTHTYSLPLGFLDKATEVEVELHAGHRN